VSGVISVDGKSIRSDRFVIATGSHPRIVDLPGAKKASALISTTLMDLDKLSDSLIVLGGRAVALELSQTMVRLGVKVTLLQRSYSILPDHEALPTVVFTDPQIAMVGLTEAAAVH
jgi:mercuric reductase